MGLLTTLLLGVNIIMELADKWCWGFGAFLAVRLSGCIRSAGEGLSHTESFRRIIKDMCLLSVCGNNLCKVLNCVFHYLKVPYGSHFHIFALWSSLMR